MSSSHCSDSTLGFNYFGWWCPETRANGVHGANYAEDLCGHPLDARLEWGVGSDFARYHMNLIDDSGASFAVTDPLLK